MHNTKKKPWELIEQRRKNKEENTNNQVSQVKRPVKRKILNCNTRQRNKKSARKERLC